MRSPLPRIERAKPLLGTTVSVRVEGLPEAEAHRAIDAAFGEVALIHRLMSFQDGTSDISRLNRGAFASAQDVHPATYEVLHAALELSEASDGVFDITVAGRLAERGILPRPFCRQLPAKNACWQDVQLGEDYSVRFRRPLFIDVSGIAKGYAVDRAVAVLKRHGAAQAAVNAGGDLCVFGPDRERIALRTAPCGADALPMLEIDNAAVASSSGEIQPGSHVDPRDGRPISANRFAAVVAESCMIADALTKPALILADRSEALLCRYGATAYLHAPQSGWRPVGAIP